MSASAPCRRIRGSLDSNNGHLTLKTDETDQEGKDDGQSADDR
jgi:hypothetical protein